MSMIIEKATELDINELEELYNTLNDYLACHINYPGWIKNIYPVRDTAIAGIEEKSLFVARINGRIAGTVILRHKPEPAYEQADWGMDLDYKDILVVYTFAVHPDYLRKGIGKSLMKFIIEYSTKMNMKAIRLDVYEKNFPAISLYKSYGFNYIGAVDLGYSNYGLDYFELYQKKL